MDYTLSLFFRSFVASKLLAEECDQLLLSRQIASSTGTRGTCNQMNEFKPNKHRQLKFPTFQLCSRGRLKEGGRDSNWWRVMRRPPLAATLLAPCSAALFIADFGGSAWLAAGGEQREAGMPGR